MTALPDISGIHWPNVVPVISEMDGGDREAWLKARRTMFTASDAAALLGRHEYRDMKGVIGEKVNPESSTFDPNQDHIVQGSLFEPSIAAYASRVFECDLHQVGVLIRDNKCPQLGATPDYFCSRTPAAWSMNGRPAVVQIKMTLAKPEHGDGVVHDVSPNPGSSGIRAWGDHIPSYIWHQVQVERAVLAPAARVAGALPLGGVVMAYHRRNIPQFGSGRSQLTVYTLQSDDVVVDRIRQSARAAAAMLPRDL